MMTTVALLGPAAKGVKVTVIVQKEFPWTGDPQVLVWLKSPGFTPTIIRPLTVSCLESVLVSVTVSGAELLPSCTLPKSQLAGESVSGATVSTPCRSIVCGLAGSASEMVKLPDCGPAARLGLKTRLTEQEASGARFMPLQVSF